MVILASLFGVIGKQAGRILTTALGWASTLLFGRVPKDRQIVFALVTLGSLLWVALVLGVIVPGIGTFLLAAVPAPSFVREDWIRLAMLAAALLLPLVIGIASLFVSDAAERPKGAAIVPNVLRGYPLAFLLAFMLGFLAVVGIARKARSLARRWTDAHIPIVVRPGGYDRVVADLEEALDQAGLAVDRRPAPKVMSVPARLVARVAGGGVRRFVPDNLTLLASPTLEVGVYPSDVSIAGAKADVARARAALASRLTSTAAHLTTSKESQQVEDRLEALAREALAREALANRPPAAEGHAGPVLPDGVEQELAEIDAILARFDVDYDEWEVLYRMRLQVERDLMAGAPVGQAFPGQVTSRPAPSPASRAPAGLGAVLGAAAMALVALDVLVALIDRFRPGSR